MQKKWRIIFFVWIVILGASFACKAEKTKEPNPQRTNESTEFLSSTDTVTDPLTAQIDQYMQEKYQMFSGTVLVARKSEALIILSYGLADREHEVPNKPETKYAIGSIGKSFTAMAIMILEERGLLEVEDAICIYLPDCPDAWEPVTLHHLLNHTSGIPSFTDLASQGEIEGEACIEYTPDEIVAFFRDFPLEFIPGSRWHYNNSGYFLLGMIIEEVTGESYETFIQENILLPLEMSDTGYNHAHEIVKNRASGYSLDVIEPINAPYWHVSAIYSAGGWYSTVGDLYKWDQALYTDQLVSYETLGKILSASADIQNDIAQYGYGWFILETWGHRTIEHNGEVSGFLSRLVRYPDDQVTIIVLSNYDRLDVLPISRELAAIVFGE